MTLPVGTRLGGLEILRLLGAGGMGEVYLARDHELHRTVAVKVLPADVTSDAQRVERFEREARAASALNHPNVCVIHALGKTDDGRRFIAMEHVEGETLRARIDRGRLAFADALDIAGQIATALTAAHAANLVHRDIKPENVMIRPDGLVKVLDFGLAKLTPSGMALAADEQTRTRAATDPGSLVGTVAYMAPEQARGTDVDARADIWALGVVLYEMVTGRPPFAGATRSDVLAAVLEREPVPLPQQQPNVPPELQRIVGKTLRKDPEERYQVMKDLLLDLKALRSEVVSGVNSGALAPVTRARSQTISPAGLALGALVVVLIAAGAWWLMRSADGPDELRPRVDRPLKRLTFDEGLQTDAAFSPDGRSIAYASNKAGNFDIWVQSLDGGDARQITTSSEQETQPAWSPDGRQIVFRSERDGGGLYIVPVDGGPERLLSSFGQEPRWLLSGDEILFRAGPRSFLTPHLFAIRPGVGAPPREILSDFLSNGLWTWIAPHPDGRISAIGIKADGTFGFFTVGRDGNGEISSTFAADLPFQPVVLGRVARFEWDSSGKALFVECLTDGVRDLWKVRVDPTTLAWSSAERLTAGAEAKTRATLSPDGARLAFTISDEWVQLWSFPFDPVAGRVVGEGQPVTPEDEDAASFALSPNGRYLAYVSLQVGRSGGDTWLLDFNTGTRERFAASTHPGGWSPDSTTLAYLLDREHPPVGEYATAVREIGGPERILRPWSAESVFIPSSWFPDGETVAGLLLSPPYTDRGKVASRSVRLPLDQPDRILLADPQQALWQAHVSPDGRWLAFVAVSGNTDDPSFAAVWVAPSEGAPPDRWQRVASTQRWADKPRWSPDGKALYFVSTGERSSFFNLSGQRFEPDDGSFIGDPFRITDFQSPEFVLLADVGTSELGIATQRAVLQMTSTTGHLWMLENVNR